MPVVLNESYLITAMSQFKGTQFNIVVSLLMQSETNDCILPAAFLTI